MRVVQFTCKASTSRIIHANSLQQYLNLFENSGFFTCNFTSETHANSLATGMQNYLFCLERYIQFADKSTRNRKQKYVQLQAKMPGIAGKNQQIQAKIPVIADKNTCNCRQKVVLPELLSQCTLYFKCCMSFIPMPSQPQQFKSFTLSTACLFNRVPM